MAVYFVHMHDGAMRYAPIETMPFPNAGTALAEGGAAAWWLMCNLSEHVKDWSDWRVEVTDETGRTVVVLPFALILRTSSPPRDPTSHRDRAWG